MTRVMRPAAGLALAALLVPAGMLRAAPPRTQGQVSSGPVGSPPVDSAPLDSPRVDSPTPGYARACEREWLRRAWALDPAAHAADLRAALDAPDWRARHDALEALARSAAGAAWCRTGEVARRVVDRVVDEHPSVRAQAIVLVARAGLLADAMARHGGALAAETFPDARLQLARAWGAGSGAATGPARASLLAWEASADERLAAAAFDALVALARPDPAAGSRPRTGAWGIEPTLAWLFDARPEERARRWEAALAALERDGFSGFTDDVVAAWRAALGADGRLPAALPALELGLLRAGPAGRSDGDAAAGIANLVEALPALLAHEHWRDALLATARVRPPGLGVALWRAVEERLSATHAVPGRLELLVECASEASEPWTSLAAARALSVEHAELVWGVVGTRVRRWDASRGAYWLAAGRAPELRGAAARVLGRVAVDAPSSASIEALLALAVDDDPSLREQAFRWLCELPADAGVGPRLREAWSTYEAAEQLERLRDLPRDVAPHAFREELLRLGESPATRSTSVVELLALFRGDARVAARVDAWLNEALDELARTAAGDPALRARERRARGLLVARVRTGVRTEATAESAEGAAGAADRAGTRVGARVGARAALARALARGVAWIERNGAATLELAEVAVASLGAEPGGAAELAPYLDSAPGRVRIEVALALAQDPELGARAQELLAERYASLDMELRTRALRACTPDDPRHPGVPHGPGLELLRRVAADSGAAWEQRFVAQNGLAAHGELADLEERYAAAGDIEVRLACLGAIASVPGPRARDFLVDVLHARAPRGFVARPRNLGDEEAALLVDEVLLLLAARGELGPDERALWLRRARASAAADLEARFAGRTLPRVDFRWRTELALARVLAESGELREALAGSGPWRRLDPDFLLALADAVRVPEPAVAAELFRAAAAGYAGQPDTPTAVRRGLDAQLRLVQLALGEAPPVGMAELAWSCRRLLEAERAGVDVKPLVERRMGTRDRSLGRDPRAWVASAAEQAEARAALARGDLEAAHRHAARARSRLGSSRAAAEAQRRLETLLTGSGGR